MSVFHILFYILVNASIVSSSTLSIDFTWGATRTRSLRRPIIPTWGKKKTRSIRNNRFAILNKKRRNIVHALIDYFESLVE